MRGAFFASGHEPPFFVSKAGNKGAPCRVNSPRAHQRDPQTGRRNDAMAWSTPEVREVGVGMEVTSYLSAEM
jgi:coenzyme PQQ precursor peptide PqqA